MTVAQLINRLRECVQDREVRVPDDGHICGVVRIVPDYKVGSVHGHQLTVVLLDSDLLG